MVISDKLNIHMGFLSFQHLHLHLCSVSPFISIQTTNSYTAFIFIYRAEYR